MNDKFTLGDIQRLVVEPDDTLVITLDEHHDDDEIRYLKDSVEERLPGVRVLVLSPGCTLSVVSAAR